VKSAAAKSDVFISVAAVADYRAKKPSSAKIKKSNGAPLTLELEENPDILAHVAAMKNAPFCVGFAAESEDLARHASEKRRRKNIPLIAANLAQEALGGEENAIKLYDERGEHDLGRGSKLELARKLVAHVAGMLPAGNDEEAGSEDPRREDPRPAAALCDERRRGAGPARLPRSAPRAAGR
jgi:phosphopantothenoylcysteine decarboxylase/phosphopantothenate--cysteine ligase